MLIDKWRRVKRPTEATTEWHNKKASAGGDGRVRGPKLSVTF